MTEFIQLIEEAIQNTLFVKLTLSKSRIPDIKNIYFKLVVLKKGTQLNVTYRQQTQDITKNYDLPEGLEQVKKMLSNDFGQGILFTLKQDVHIRVSPHGQIKLKHYPPTFSQIPPTEHDKIKQRPLNAEHDFLQALGITYAQGDQKGKVKADMQSKYRQINRFIELLTPYLKNFDNQKALHLVDMGSGKGYLTFALYNYITQTLQLPLQAEGVELRPNLVQLCNNIAEQCHFEGLHFKEASIDSFPLPRTDILIALHACNTATDDALYKGIQAQASLMVVAPCCHKQVRHDLQPTPVIQGITQFGIFKERQAELLTDTLRALLLESQGYKTSVFEFISGEDTAKNIMIIAEKRKKATDTTLALKQIADLKLLFGLKTHYLEELLFKNK